MNKKMKTMLLSLGLVGVVGTGATLAYFTAGPQQVNNTFTFGKGYGEDGFKLFEHNITADGSLGDQEVNANKYVDVYPGQTLPKDPTIRLDASVESYVYITIDQSQDLEVVATGSNLNDWKEVTNAGLDGKKMYFYDKDENDEPDKVAKQETLTLFNKVKIKDTVGNDNSKLEINMNIQAAAIQATDMNYGSTEAINDIAKGLFK